MEAGFFSWNRARQFGFSLVDQGLSVGGMFLVNIALARTQTKTEYGVFVLCYSVFTFLSGLHNAAILETYTVYGSGRYNRHFVDYEALLWRSNGILGLGLTAVLFVVWAAVSWSRPGLAARPLLGMALACAVLLTASFVRRTFYMRRRPDLAARLSAVYFLACSLLLLALLRSNLLSGFTAFLIVAVSWCIAGVSLARELPGSTSCRSFTEIEPRYWTEHWKYTRWVFLTAFVFQLTAQGYYWLAAGFLTVKEVGDLRAMINLVSPVDQIYIAMSSLILPMMARRYASDRMTSLLPLWRAYCVGGLLVTACFAALVNVFGKRVMHVLYAGRFDDIASLLGGLAFLPAVMAVGNTMNDALKASEKPKLVFCAYVSSGGATFLVGIPLVMHFGLQGAVYGMLFSAATYSAALAIGFLFHVQKKVWQHA